MSAPGGQEFASGVTAVFPAPSEVSESVKDLGVWINIAPMTQLPGFTSNGLLMKTTLN